MIDDSYESKINKYIAETAREQIEVFEFRKRNPQYLYLSMTMYNPREIFETEGEPEDFSVEELLLDRLIPSSPDEWTLGSLGVQMLEMMEQWFRLYPKFTEFL